jgi:hypothetical protein
MPLTIHQVRFWQISPAFVLDSRFRFGDRAPATKFVYRPPDQVLVLGTGREVPSHKALISSVRHKPGVDTSQWVRGIVLRERRIVYYRQGVADLGWYEATTAMLREHGLPPDYRIAWGAAAKKELAEDLVDYP